MGVFSKQDYKDGASWVTYGAWIVGLIILAVFALSFIFKPAALVGKTMETDNIIHKYEWFYDTSNAINSRVAQIKAHKALVDGAQGSEKSRLQVEMAGMQQSCRDLVAQYNANASKVNVAIFKTDSTPSSFSLTVCE